jgi:hypothetical protein
MKRTECGTCHVRIVFAKTAAGKLQALNFGADPAGLVAAYCDASGQWHAKHAPAGEPVISPWKRHMPHAATCGNVATPPVQAAL